MPHEKSEQKEAIAELKEFRAADLRRLAIQYFVKNCIKPKNKKSAATHKRDVIA